jgi:hypothetical protein
MTLYFKVFQFISKSFSPRLSEYWDHFEKDLEIRLGLIFSFFIFSNLLTSCTF